MPETQDESDSAPLVIWDGECGFCRWWIEHWTTLVPADIDFETLQDVDEAVLIRHGLDREDLPAAMHFVDRHGVVHRGAAAVFEAHAGTTDRRYRAGLVLYRHVEVFRVVADAVYRWAAANRGKAQRLTEFLFGRPTRSTFHTARNLFLRLLAVSTFLAFWSMSRQVIGLLGADGILPVVDFLDHVRQVAAHNGWSEAETFWRLPTVLWLDASDTMLRSVCGVGMIGAILLFFGVAPRILIPLLWLAYLSICSVGQVFLGYQWDALLLEALFVGWFVAPWAPLPLRRFDKPVPPLGRWLVWLVAFKLVWMAGLVKVATDPAWSALEALDYHFWTQPIPNNIAHWVHSFPGFVRAAGVVFTLVAELVAPLLIFAPRRLRHLGALTMIALQLAIGLTGTYGFFNVLTIALLCMLFDDSFFRRDSPRRLALRKETWRGWEVPWAIATVILVPLVLMPLDSPRLGGGASGALRGAIEESLAPLRTFNGYGLFGHMTKTRPEISVEISDDGHTWRELDFPWKPTSVDEASRFTTLHMPRLDWQMWFAALGDCRRNPWFFQFQRALLEGRGPVWDLLDAPPTDPPRYVRSRQWSYRFGDETPWTRDLVGPYCPPLTLDSRGEVVRVR